MLTDVVWNVVELVSALAVTLGAVLTVALGEPSLLAMLAVVVVLWLPAVEADPLVVLMLIWAWERRTL